MHQFLEVHTILLYTSKLLWHYAYTTLPELNTVYLESNFDHVNYRCCSEYDSNHAIVIVKPQFTQYWDFPVWTSLWNVRVGEEAY